MTARTMSEPSSSNLFEQASRGIRLGRYIVAACLLLANQLLFAQAPAVSVPNAPASNQLEFSTREFRIPSLLNRVTSVAFSPDGQHLATSYGGRYGEPSSMAVWNLATGQLVGHVAYNNTVHHVRWTPDSKRLVSSGYNFSVRVHEFPSFKEQTLIPVDNSAVSLDLSPDGSQILTAAAGYEAKDGSAGRTILIWDAATGKLVRKCEHDPVLFHVNCADWSPTGKYIVAAGGNFSPRVGLGRIWNAQTGKEVSRLGGHTDLIYDAQFFPDDTRVATIGLDSTVRIWDSTTGKELSKFDIDRQGIDLDISPDGSRMAVLTMEGKLSLWDTMSLQKTVDIASTTQRMIAVAFSPDGRRLAAATDQGCVKIWDLAGESWLSDVPAAGSPQRPHPAAIIAPAQGGKLVVVVDTQGAMRAIAIHNESTLWQLASQPNEAPTAIVVSPDAAAVLAGYAGGQLRLINAKDGQTVRELKQLPAKVVALSYSVDGKHFAAGDAEGHVWLWDSTGQEPLAQHDNHKGAVLAIGFSAQHSAGVSVAVDGTASRWNAKSGEILQQEKLSSSPLKSAAISRDGSTLATRKAATAGPDIPSIWDVATFQPPTGDSVASSLQNITGPGLEVAALSADGSYLLATRRQTALLVNIRRRQPPVLWSSSTDATPVVAIAPDDRFLYMTNDLGGLTIRAAVPARRPALGRLARAGNAVTAAVSPDGKWLATSGDDSQVCIWDLKKGELVDVLSSGGGCWVCRFSADSRMLATGTLDGTVKVWNMADLSLQGAEVNVHPAVRSLVFSPDGRWLVTGGSDRVIKVINLKSWEITPTQPEQIRWVTGLAFASGGRRLYSVTGVWDPAQGAPLGDLTMWSAQADKTSLKLTPEKTIRAHNHSIDSVVISNDGKLVITAGWDRQVKVWNAANLDLVRTFSPNQAIHRIYVIPGDRSLLAIGDHSGGVSVWNYNSAELVANYTGHRGNVFDITSLPNGRGLITASEDDSLMFWPGPGDDTDPDFVRFVNSIAPAKAK